MQTAGNPKSLNRLPLLAFVWLCRLTCVDGASSQHLRNEDGAVIPDHPVRPRIPHHAFQTWMSSPPASWMGAADQAKKPAGLMDAVNRFRAKICFDMKDAHGEKFNSFTACKEFMEKACRPGGDLKMDGDTKEISSGKGYCKEYFPESEQEIEKVAEEELAEEEAQEEEAASVKADESNKLEAGDDVAGKEAVAKEDAAKEAVKGKAKEAQGVEAAAAPAPAAAEAGAKAAEGAGGAGGAPAPAPAAGGPAGPGPAPPPLPADEAWYWKKDGKDPGRLHMNEEHKLPTQGYYGKLVEHNDMETSASDWGAEFGASDAKSVAAVCRKHPDSQWCRNRGYRPLSHHSGTSMPASVVASMLLVIGIVVNFV